MIYHFWELLCCVAFCVIHWLNLTKLCIWFTADKELICQIFCEYPWSKRLCLLSVWCCVFTKSQKPVYKMIHMDRRVSINSIFLLHAERRGIIGSICQRLNLLWACDDKHQHYFPSTVRGYQSNTIVYWPQTPLSWPRRKQENFWQLHEPK